jgi:hypothetical protein
MIEKSIFLPPLLTVTGIAKAFKSMSNRWLPQRKKTKNGNPTPPPSASFL